MGDLNSHDRPVWISFTLFTADYNIGGRQPALHTDDTPFCWNLVCLFHSKPRIIRINKVIIRAMSIVNFNSTLMFIESIQSDKIIFPICVYPLHFHPPPAPPLIPPNLKTSAEALMITARYMIIGKGICDGVFNRGYCRGSY